ncbi:UvrD/REP helicase [Treponema vincentii ATCC 35580]|uniref:DNA 3'-5' helicase n=2 Tax=Treponema vincentii TaxID=69710 RepID=C8PM70_9SPIR|nr:UvrD/REP helicase [Treponema vincentii ATCC 35580]
MEIRVRNMIDICKDLNEHQKQAVKINENAVVAAGAGSGKTKVLASRYVYLITEKNYQVENILALTFTDKAAAEMHRRIYRELQKMYTETDDAMQRNRAGAALDSFFKAQIMTIDAFCHKIAVTACRRFGISPDFTIDLTESKRLAYNLSLDFFLEHRADNSLQYLLGNQAITDFINGFFVKILNDYVTVSRPIDFSAALQNQLSAAEQLFTEYRTQTERILEGIASYLDKNDKFISAVKEAYRQLPEFPLMLNDPQLPVFFERLKAIYGVKKTIGSRTDEEVKACKDLCSALSENSGRLQSLYHFYAHKEQMQKIYALCSVLQERFIAEKKRRSILHFGDIAQLAVDALITDPDLRLFYKKQTHRIMIDEFQDNNSLQRDLLFLLAEKEARTDQSIPKPDELVPDKLFFVGDEKQSIYAFRGADVSVFRMLSQDLRQGGSSASINLQTNYRTEPDLLNFFNTAFMQVFYSEVNQPLTGGVPAFEAEFIPILSRDAVPNLMPQTDILFIDKKRFANPSDTDTVMFTPIECEAYTLAQKIADIHAERYLVYDEALHATRPCTWSDFAVLLRASTHQAVYERFFRAFKIPYISVQQKGLFHDAPLNDICALLRLAVYPNDRAVYAQTLRSPFVRLSDRSFTRLMLYSLEHEGQPFNPAAAEELEAEDRQYFLTACALFERIQGYIKKKSNAELITALWYDEGYRYILLTEPRYHRYLELYDYLFALAVKADEAKQSLSAFIDTLISYIHAEERIEDMEIPLEHGGDAVKIMTVHKSKGLEFPIVCIPDCGNAGKSETKEGMVFLHKDLGPVIHLPPETKNDPSANIFFEELRQEANAKHLAETKRLLYVAVTRAKVRLVMSGVQETGCDAEDLPEFPRGLEEIRQQLVQPQQEEKNRSFFQLLLPAVSDDIAGLHFAEVLPLPASTVQHTAEDRQRFNLDETRALYRQAAEKNFPLAEPRVIPATQFEKDTQWLRLSEAPLPSTEHTEKEIAFSADAISATDAASTAKPVDGNIGAEQGEDELSSTEFGTLVHKAMEARFLDRPCILPAKYAREVEKLCAAFLSSPFGQKAAEASFRKTEYGFLTLYEGKLIIGQIDLLFEYEDTAYIIDYKTDQKIYPEKHRKQLLIYKTAVENFYKMEGFGQGTGGSQPKPVKAYIFYLRSKTAVEVV